MPFHLVLALKKVPNHPKKDALQSQKMVPDNCPADLYSSGMFFWDHQALKKKL